MNTRKLFLLICMLLPLSLAAGLDDTTPQLKPGTPVNGIILLDQEINFTTFRIRVPEDAWSYRISIENSRADLDLYIKYESKIENYNEVDHFSTTDDFNEVLFLSQLGEYPIQPGEYYLDVVYQRRRPPVYNGKEMSEIPFTIKFDLVTGSSVQLILPGEPVTMTLDPSRGMFQVYKVEVPPKTRTMRIDLFNTIGDIDLLVSRTEGSFSWDTADYASESFVGNENMLITKYSSTPLQAGIYTIVVVDQVGADSPEEVSMYIGFDEDPPEFLKKIPAIPDSDNPQENSLYATIEVIADAGKGSGCLVSPDGLFLTNWHVVQSDSGKPSQKIFVGVNLSFFDPPAELFRAEFVAWDESLDLALLRITGGIYGQELPFGFRFPYHRISRGEFPGIAQPISIIGFPGIGGTGSRASVSLTRGIVTGYERTPFGIIIKTDAEINGGSSGGAALNIYWELIGLPTSVVGEDAGQLGYIYPVNLLPEDWLRMIDQRQEVSGY